MISHTLMAFSNADFSRRWEIFPKILMSTFYPYTFFAFRKQPHPL